MPKTVMIMRHGQAEDAASDDLLRPLTATGRLAAAAMGRAILDRAAAPGTILTSHALRAQETAEEVAGAWGFSHPIVQLPELYSGSELGYLDCLQALPDSAVSVLMVGHNPSIADLAARLWSSGAAMGPFAPGSIGCLSLAIDGWEKLGWGGGLGVWFLSPADIST